MLVHFGPPNGMRTILDAAKILQATHPSIQFRIIGDGSAKEKLKLYARSKNMTTVTFAPAITRQNVPSRTCKRRYSCRKRAK